MESTHEQLVEAQFGPRAAAYLASAVHAAGPDLLRIAEIARSHRGAVVLDLGCGGGHVTYQAAPHAARVVACDLSQGMLDAVAGEAAQRGLENVETVLAPADRLPFEAASFDLVLCRYSAHHWVDWEAGLRETRRVVKPDGLVVFGDVIAPESALADTHLQAWELLRDPSHVRDYRVDEWIAALGRAGLPVTGLLRHELRLDFASWITRMATPESTSAAIRALQEGAPQGVRRALQVEPDGSFTAGAALFEARPALDGA